MRVVEKEAAAIEPRSESILDSILLMLLVKASSSAKAMMERHGWICRGRNASEYGVGWDIICRIEEWESL